MSAVSASSVRDLLVDVADCFGRLPAVNKLPKADKVILDKSLPVFARAVANASYKGNGRYVCLKEDFNKLKAIYFDVSRICLGCLLKDNRKSWGGLVACNSSSAHIDLKKYTPRWGAAEEAYRVTIPNDDAEKAAKHLMFKGHIKNVAAISALIRKVAPTIAIAEHKSPVLSFLFKWGWLIAILITALFLTNHRTIKESVAGEAYSKCRGLFVKQASLPGNSPALTKRPESESAGKEH